ncbi:MAG: glycoside hydrolase family 43 protein [Sphingobacterium composti]|uniref:glycoside hydrolase family 43 protein n=1 Tax=Sphingobacterium composti TaxID=363260 RepID=UPI00135CCD56|nr:glycoside hydrolase family 43 protein [Sphingobacterium composti Ten et al. 2007 non Yoo et al. 2007]
MKNYAIALFFFVIYNISIGNAQEKFTFKDTDGKHINAHGGGILKHKGKYYWYGEIKEGESFNSPSGSRRVDAGGVSCYSSKDLKTWKNEGVVLPSNKTDPNHDLHISKVIERPKVIYNKKTKKFVMWMHIDTDNYALASSGVAVSDSPSGPFTYIESVRPHGYEARDMTIFVDDDGKAYHFYSSEGNRTMHVGLLSDDYLKHTGKYKRIFIDIAREAPAVFKYKKKYYMVTSGLTGWYPNEANFAVSDEIMGDWENKGNPCKGKDAHITYWGQGTFVSPVNAKKNKFIFMADKWNEKDLKSSTYIWKNLYVNKNNEVVIGEDEE